MRDEFVVAAIESQALEFASLTTEYPANGSFSDHTHAVCIDAYAGWLKAQVLGLRHESA